jgi:hypothetical protein
MVIFESINFLSADLPVPNLVRGLNPRKELPTMRTFLGRVLPVTAALVSLAFGGPVQSHHHCYHCWECPAGWAGCPPNNYSHWS